MTPKLAHNPPDANWQSQEKRSAVCFLLMAVEGEPDHLVLTRRTTGVGSHKGQIGFAGGRADPDDNGPVDTALRELDEELGIKASEVEVIGQLPSSRSLDQAPVVPIFMRTRVPVTNMNPSPAEVAAILCAPWTEFTRASASPFQFNIYGEWRESLLYMIPDTEDRVWGLTARLIYDADMK